MPAEAIERKNTEFQDGEGACDDGGAFWFGFPAFSSTRVVVPQPACEM